MTPRKTPVRVLRSPLTGEIYAVTKYTTVTGGMIRAQIKHDVTADVDAIVNRTLSEALTEVEEALATHEPLLAVGAVLASYRKPAADTPEVSP